MSPGRMVVVEGLDGVGKSTLVVALASRLGVEPIATPGEAFRPVRAAAEAAFQDSPLARQLFYATTVLAASERAARVLAAGGDVVVDRYLLSTLVYAGARGPTLDLEPVLGALTVPDLTVYLRVDEAERRRRLDGRATSTEEDRWTLDARRRAALDAAFRALVLGHPVAGRGVVVDGTGRTAEELVDEVVRELEAVGRGRLWG